VRLFSGLSRHIFLSLQPTTCSYSEFYLLLDETLQVKRDGFTGKVSSDEDTAISSKLLLILPIQRQLL
jgi:hypothetical protein